MFDNYDIHEENRIKFTKMTFMKNFNLFSGFYSPGELYELNIKSLQDKINDFEEKYLKERNTTLENLTHSNKENILKYLRRKFEDQEKK